MNNTLIFTLRENLDNLIQENVLNDKFIVLFGMNTPGDEVINYLARKGFSVNAVIDNNVLNKGKKLAGVSVYLPGDVLADTRTDAIILICSRYFSEMKKQLEEMGYDASQIIKVLEMSSGVNYSLEKQVLEDKVNVIRQAYGLHYKLKKKYGENIKIFVSPVKANGDVYIIASLMKNYIRENPGEKIILAVVGGVCKRIAGMFGLNNVITVTQEEMELLVKLSGFMGYENSGIKIVQPYYMYTGIFRKMEGYKGITFRDMFAYGYFPKLLNKKPDIHINRKTVSQIETEAKVLGIVKGKTIIFAPYANSLPQIEWKIWENIAEGLANKGYKLFTNSASDSEMAIPGTERIFFTIEDAVSILDYAGGFVAMRNGLCEVVSSSKCRQVIIYPDKAGRFGKMKDIYGIRAMGLNENAIELEDSDNIIDEVLEVF
ncbi:MAG: hypothetical protein IJC76_06275 [Lachnospiraceae bacterium]|nr:hypothetical protein [Lachnospiraceae bacterium]